MNRIPAGLPLSQRLVLVNWISAVRREGGGRPVLPVEFVAEQGRAVIVLDVRSDAEIVGPAGYIPGSARLPFDRLAEVWRALPQHAPVVLVCGRGEVSAKGAAYLETLGMTFVAALDGGIHAWKAAGYATSRDPEILTRHFGDAPLTPPSPRGPIDADTVLRHVGDPGAVRWMKIGGFLMNGRQACVDGRDEQGVIGTPGGDAGEFLLALSCVEDRHKRVIEEAEITQWLQAFADTFGRFYMHSDTNAMNTQIRALRADERIAPALKDLDSANSWRAFMKEPPVEVRAALLEHLVNPAHLGCGHLRLMLTQPDRYRIRAGLVVSFLRAFHQLRWAGCEELDWVVLGGEHREEAVLNVTVGEEIWPFTRIPLISPTCEGHQTFVNHPQVISYFRRNLAQFVSSFKDLYPAGPAGAQALYEAMSWKAGIQLGNTLATLASGLPVYTVEFHDGGVAVSAAGKV